MLPRNLFLVTLVLLLSQALPAQALRDNFNRTNQSLVTPPWHQSSDGEPLEIFSNELRAENTTNLVVGTAWFDTAAVTLDSLSIGIRIKKKSTDTYATTYGNHSIWFGVMGDPTDMGVATGWRLALDNNVARMELYIAGTAYNYGEMANVVEGDTVRLSFIGSTVRLLVNGVQRGTDITGWGLPTTVKPVIQLLTLGDKPTVDDFRIGRVRDNNSGTPGAGAANQPATISNVTITKAGGGVPTRLDEAWWTLRVTDDTSIDSIYFWRSTVADGTVNLLRLQTQVANGRTLVDTSTYHNRSVLSPGSYNWTVRVVDDSGAVTTATGSSLVSDTSSTSAGNKWYTVYYGLWAMGPINSGTGVRISPWELDMTRMTHIVHFSGGNISQTAPYLTPLLNATDSMNWAYSTTHWPTNPPTHFQDSLITIANRKGVKVLFSIGAVDAANLNFVASDSARTDVFCHAVGAYCQRKGYHGIELDWEGWITPVTATVNVQRMVRRLRIVTGSYFSTPMVFTVSAQIVDQDIYPAAICDQYIDQYNLQHYVYQWQWNQNTSRFGTYYNSPLFTRSDFPAAYGTGPRSIVASKNTWIYTAGHARSKMGIGVPVYGTTIRDVNVLYMDNPVASPYASYGQSTQKQIQSLLTVGGTYTYDTQAEQPVISGTASQAIGSPGSYQQFGVAAGQRFWATYNDERSLTAMVRTVVDSNYGGFMAYDLSNDIDAARTVNGSYTPMHEYIRRALGAGNTVITPGTVTLTSPANAATGIPRHSSPFTWSTATNALAYHIQFSTDAAFTQLVYENQSLPSNSFSIASNQPLQYSTVYYWRVSGRSTDGTQGNWSTSRSFTTVNQSPTIPGVPTLSNPANGATGITAAMVTLSWIGADSLATQFHIQVAYDAAFSLVYLEDSTETSFTRTVLNMSSNTLYYWRVAAKNPVGKSAFTAARNYRTELADTSTAVQPIRVAYHDPNYVRPGGGKGLNLWAVPPYYPIGMTNASNIPNTGMHFFTPDGHALHMKIDGIDYPVSAGGSSSMTGQEILDALNGLPSLYLTTKLYGTMGSITPGFSLGPQIMWPTASAIDSGDVLGFKSIDLNGVVKTEWIKQTGGGGGLPLTGGTLSGPLNFSGTGHAGIIANGLTTTQRNALTAVEGMFIRNATTGRFNGYLNSNWYEIPNLTDMLTTTATDGQYLYQISSVAIGGVTQIPAAGLGNTVRTEFIPVEWMIDGATAPSAASTYADTRKVRIRAFSNSAANDLEFFWQNPGDAVDGDGGTAEWQLKWRPIYMITTTAPASGEGVTFSLSGAKVADSDDFGASVGTESDCAFADLNGHANGDIVYGAYTAITVASGAAGNGFVFFIRRDVADSNDDYAQTVGLVGIEFKYVTTHGLSY